MTEKAELRIGDYILKETLGKGTFGKVKVGIHSGNGHKVAVKIMSRARIRSMDVVDKIRKEIKLQRLFRHPHIIRLYQAFSTPTDIFMIMEYVSGGELFTLIRKKGKLTEAEARLFFQQLVSGIDYCHRHMVVHRDIKPENLLLDSQNNIKIADFGLSTLMTDGGFLDTSCGSPNYASPEILSGKLYAGPEVDIWSCGVILFAMTSGHLPFQHDHTPTLFKLIRAGTFHMPDKFSPELKVLLAKILQVDPDKRCTVRQMLTDAWFTTDLPAYLFLNEYADTSMLDLESVAAVAEQCECTADEVKAAIKDGNPQDPRLIAYYILSENKHIADRAEPGKVSLQAGTSTLRVMTKKLSPFSSPKLKRNRIQLSPNAGAAVKGNPKGHTCRVRAASKGARWCRPNCELCPTWPGVEECVFGNFVPDLAHCDTCTHLGKPGCLFSDTPNESVEDLGKFIKGLTTSDRPERPHPEHVRVPENMSASLESGDGKNMKALHNKFKKAKWHLGIRSASPPAEIMLEIYRVMKGVGLEWQVISPYSCTVRQAGQTGVEQITVSIDLYQLDGIKGGYLLDFLSHSPASEAEAAAEAAAEAGEMDWEPVSRPRALSLSIPCTSIAPRSPKRCETDCDCARPKTPLSTSPLDEALDEEPPPGPPPKSEIMSFFEISSGIIEALARG